MDVSSTKPVRADGGDGAAGGGVAPAVREAARRVTRPELRPRARDERVPASYAQRRLWFVDRLQGGSVEYNVMQAVRLTGRLDVAALEGAFTAIAARHESLRTCFAETAGEPWQVILPPAPVAVPVTDLRGLAGDTQAAVQRTIRMERETPFVLATGPLWRVRLVVCAAEEHVLIWTFHHIVTDAWSQSVFRQELQALYAAQRSGAPARLPAVPVQYADFALWQRTWLDGAGLNAGLAYWRQQLTGSPPQLALPLDRPRPAQPTSAADRCVETVAPALWRRLTTCSQQHGATLYMTLLAALGVVVARHTGQDDLIVGAPVANRPDRQLEGLIGFFVNSLALRLRLRGAESFAALLGQVRQTTLEAYRHQDVPFERVVEAVAPERQLNQVPLVRVSLVLQNAPQAAVVLSGLTVTPVRGEGLQVRTDLEVHAVEHDGGAELTWIYNTALFDPWRIAQLAAHYTRVLAAIADDPTQPINAMWKLITAEATSFGTPATAPPAASSQATMPALFEAQVQRTPDAIAVVDDTAALTYGMLNTRANAVAAMLLARRIGPEAVVALALPRTYDLVIAILGVLKAGAAYLPLDPDHPPSQLARTLADAEPVCVLTTQAIEPRLLAAVDRIALDASPIAAQLLQRFGNPADADRTSPLTGTHPAYLLYTSGSTGQPKGVLGLHEGLVNRLTWLAAQPGMTTRTHVLAKTPLVFIDGTTELLGPLIAGGTVVLAAPHDIDRLPAMIARHQIDRLTIVPSLLTTLIDTWPARLPTPHGVWLVSGERLDASTIARAAERAPGMALWNLYGSSEASGDSTWTPDAANGTVGAPIWNTRILLLDSRLERVPVGATGEIYVAGVGLARGYWKQPALTSSRFVANPFGPPGARLYRTGDLARWTPEGTPEFQGRADQQVKIRGVRIEPAEIEAALRAQPEVREPLVIARQLDGETRLVAYVIPSAGRAIDVSDIRARLRQALPSTLIPSAIVPLTQWPTTATGKIDRAALPLPTVPIEKANPARTPIEATLCELFEEVLDRNGIGRDDDFFALGGHSLLATRLVSRIEARLNVGLQLRDVFLAPTVGELGSIVSFLSDRCENRGRIEERSQ